MITSLLTLFIKRSISLQPQSHKPTPTLVTIPEGKVICYGVEVSGLKYVYIQGEDSRFSSPYNWPESWLKDYPTGHVSVNCKS